LTRLGISRAGQVRRCGFVRTWHWCSAECLAVKGGAAATAKVLNLPQRPRRCVWMSLS
jgi:hypothetical protein